jgi:hypothetical protein
VRLWTRRVAANNRRGRAPRALLGAEQAVGMHVEEARSKIGNLHREAIMARAELGRDLRAALGAQREELESRMSRARRMISVGSAHRIHPRQVSRRGRG